MLDDEQKKEVEVIVARALDKAEGIWGRNRWAFDEGYRADSAVTKRERVPSRIPGHKEVEAGKEQVGTFIALVADMRESHRHLMCAIADAKATELERVFYETSALLPALERTVEYQGGAVTEYLGDGVLGLFNVDDANREGAIRASYAAARNCLGDARKLVNDALRERYRLPPLDLGVGMAISKAVVSLVGMEGNSHPKVIGKCVYLATKLADGKNEIVVDEAMEDAWPSSKGGGLRFEKRSRGDVRGFLVIRKSGE